MIKKQLFSIFDLILFSLAVLSQSLMMFIFLFITKFMSYLVVINYDNLESDEIKTEVTIFLNYLKDKGVISFRYITDQVVWYGSIIAIWLLLYNSGYTVASGLFLVIFGLIHLKLIDDLWKIVRSFN